MKKAYISALAGDELKEYLSSKSCELHIIKGNENLAGSSVVTHPDIYMCSFPTGIYFGKADALGRSYPDDVLYNAAVVGGYIICSKYTSPDLIEKSMLKPLVVPQGYVKCNIAVLDEAHIITEDCGIAKALRSVSGISCLLIEPHQVELAGHEYGFIGGASGRMGSEMIFNGDLSSHSDFDKIKSLVESCGLSLKYFENYPLTDIGSIIIDESAV